MKVSDVIAEFLEKKKIKHVFGIIGSGNAHIFDSISQRGYTEIICVHHEQAACMAMQTYYRTCGQITASIVTTGAGSTNAITGVVSAWMDSIPGIIISGNENSKFTSDDNPLRIWGIQGYDSVEMVRTVTKYGKRITDPNSILLELEKAYDIAGSLRPGPVWLDVPMNIQASPIELNNLLHYEAIDSKLLSNDLCLDVNEGIAELVPIFLAAKRPVIWLGHGIRLANAVHLIKPIIEKLQAPVLVSWAGIDMIPSNHPLVFGRAGIYGQRAANFVLQNCDFLLTIGTRLAIPQIGYDITELAREAKIAVVDIDPNEILKYSSRITLPILSDAKSFLTNLLEVLHVNQVENKSLVSWLKNCNEYKNNYPAVREIDHPDKDGFINSYPFMERLALHFKPDQIITTDMGTALLSGHQVLELKESQRLMTSTGLGEMGYGLPAAIGASFALNKKEVICLNCDGGMMMNLQELQTVVHHQLPIKLFIFNNDGYLMIKHTQKALFKGRYSGTDKKSGVTCPNFNAIAAAFGIPAYTIRTWKDFDAIIPEVLAIEGPVICEVYTHPEQFFYPKLSLAPQQDGSIISPPLEDLSPLLPREELKGNMLIGVHPKSEKLFC